MQIAVPGGCATLTRLLICGWMSALLVAWPAHAATAGTAGSAASSGLRAAHQPRAAAGAITFDEYDEGTTITDEYAAQGVIFTSDVYLTTDTAQPDTPVLSGRPKFHGDIDARFTQPGTTAPATVLGFELDVGYINDRNSVEITWYDPSGSVIGSTRAQSLAINHITTVGAGIASFSVREISTERAGFTIDNLSITRAAVGIKPTRIVGFGDSYSSGEGLLPEKGNRYDCGTDLHQGLYYENTTLPLGRYWLRDSFCDLGTGSTTAPKDLYKRKAVKYTNLCHRHRRAYPNQIRERLGVSAQNGLFVACSGAVTQNIGEVDGARAQYPNDPKTGQGGSPFGVAGGETQLKNAKDFAAGGAPDFITAGIGGNDAHFSPIITECVLHDCDKDVEFMDETINRINGSVYRDLATTYKGLRDDFPATTIAVFGYPSVIDTAQSCYGQAPGIGDGEMAFLKDQVLPTLNDAIKDAATEAGLTYIDITPATAGHGVCSASKDRWINGVQGGDDTWFGLGNESFHPNQKGHDAITQLFITRYTDGAGRLLFTNADPSPPIREPTGPEIQLGTISAGAVTPCGANCNAPAPCLQSCAIHIQGGGFAPGSNLSVVVESTPTNLGTAQVAADGTVSADFRLPSGIAPGMHAVTLDGRSPSGVHQHAIEAIRVYQRGRTTISARFAVGRRSTRVRRLRISRIQPGTVTLVCGRGRAAIQAALAGQPMRRAAGCPFTRRVFTVKKYTKRRNFSKYFTRSLRLGVTVRAVASSPQTSGRSAEYKIRSRRRPIATSACTAPGKLTSGGC